jgi:hypothetical protein
MKLLVQNFHEMGYFFNKKPPVKTAATRTPDNIESVKSSCSQKSTAISKETCNCFEDI